MIFFDSHCHINDKVFSNKLDRVLDRALSVNVLGMIVIGIDYLTSVSALKLANHNSMIYAAIGFHPHNAKYCSDNEIKRLLKISKHNKVVAWGEIGLDFYKMYSNRNIQELYFLKQICIADRLNMPIILHERNTQGRLIEILESNPNQNRKAIVHCFSGTIYELKKYLDMGFYIGITGIISILKHGKQLRKILKYIPVDKLLIETDSPYLIPYPYKNKVKHNEPAFIKNILMALAKIYRKKEDFLSMQIWKNTCEFFDIKY